jgi:ubiquitin-protein ligase
MYTRKNLASIRVRKDLDELNRSEMNNGKVTVTNTTKDFRVLTLTISPVAGAYTGSTLSFHLQIPPTYPFHPPAVTSSAPLWHPGELTICTPGMLFFLVFELNLFTKWQGALY